MFLVEAGGNILCDGHVEFVALSAIAKVKASCIVDDSSPPFGAKFLLRLGFELAEFSLQYCLRRMVVKSREQSAGVISDDIAHQDAERRKRAGARWNDNGWNRERIRQFAGVQASRSTECNQSEFARIVPAFD